MQFKMQKNYKMKDKQKKYYTFIKKYKMKDTSNTANTCTYCMGKIITFESFEIKR